MKAVDLEKLIINLSGIPREDEFDPEAGEELKKLLLVLAGDQRVIKKLTLEDMAMMFGDASRLLGQYTDQLEYGFKEALLEDYLDIRRRAV